MDDVIYLEVHNNKYFVTVCSETKIQIYDKIYLGFFFFKSPNRSHEIYKKNLSKNKQLFSIKLRVKIKFRIKFGSDVIPTF